jgi:hypothetical protein
MNAARSDAAAPRSPFFNFSPAALSWPLAACLALVVSASLYFQQARTDAPAAPVAEQPRTPQAASPQTPVVEMARQSDQALSRETRRSVSVNSEARPGVETTSTKISHAPERRRALPSRLAARAVVERASRQIEDSSSTSLIGSTPRFAASDAARSEGALIPVQLNAPEGQLKVLLRDTSGGARTISVDSVSFGSRDVIGRRGATYTRASLSSNQGVW